MTDRLPSSELSEVATSETYKPVEVEFSEIQSIGQTEKAMVARIDQDGDPDLVFQDLVEMETKVVNPASKEFTSDAIPAGEESGQCQQGGAEIETKCPVTWKEIFQTKTGKEFQNAMMGIGPDGKQDVIKGRINRDYSMREFVRRHPREALQYMEIFQREYGVPHYDLQKAIQQVAELEQNPFQVSQEDPKYAELPDQMEQDARYIELRNQLYNDHKVKVFGTTDFRDIPLERFIDLVSLDSNILYSVDAEAEKVFRETYPDVARLYDERESKRVYRDPDGLINIDRDPLFLKMLEPNSHGEVWTREEAMRRFALMYPDKAKFYAERYTELRPYLENQTEFAGKNLAETFVTTQNVVGDNLAQAENFNLEVVAINTLAQSVLERLQEAGVEARIIQIVNAGEFTEAVILPKKEIFTEKMVRVYRGVNQLDASLLKQVPYAMRAEGENETGSVVLDNLRQEVAVLANEPTYENLIKYVNKAKSQMNEIQRTKLDRDLAEIESGILKGNSVRTELIYHQIGHNGGFFDSGISPYLSVSWSPSEALEYAGLNGAILVIDVPISQIEDFGDNCTETNLKGVLDPNNITAIIPINGVNKGDPQTTEQAINNALRAISEATNVPVYDSEETQTVRTQQHVANKEKDKKQWEIDVQMVRLKRTDNLMHLFPEVGLDFQTIQQWAMEAEIDIYTTAKIHIFDFYAEKFRKLGRGGMDVSDYNYFSESEYGAQKNFDRNKITDEMLIKLRDMVQRQEQRLQKKSQN